MPILLSSHSPACCVPPAHGCFRHPLCLGGYKILDPSELDCPDFSGMHWCSLIKITNEKKNLIKKSVIN